MATVGVSSALAALLYWDVLGGWGRGLTTWLLIETVFYIVQCWRYVFLHPACWCTLSVRLTNG